MFDEHQASLKSAADDAQGAFMALDIECIMKPKSSFGYGWYSEHFLNSEFKFALKISGEAKQAEGDWNHNLKFVF